MWRDYGARKKPIDWQEGENDNKKIQVILFLKENRNLWNDNMVYQSIYNCQQNATNRRRREKEEQFIEQQSMIQAIAEAIEIPHDNL